MKPASASSSSSLLSSSSSSAPFSSSPPFDSKPLNSKLDIAASESATIKGEVTPRPAHAEALPSLLSLSHANRSTLNPATTVVAPAAGANFAAPPPAPLVTASSPRAFHASSFSLQSAPSAPTAPSSSPPPPVGTTTAAQYVATSGLRPAMPTATTATTTAATTHMHTAAPHTSSSSSSSSPSATATSTASSSSRVFPTHIESGHPVSVSMDTSGSTLPAWLETCAPASRATYPPLAGDVSCDVVIIGAGIAGLQVAYELTCRQSGLQVVVIDDGAIASGETGRTTAHLTNAFDDHYFELKKLFNASKVRQVADSHSWAIDRVEEICQREGIDCDFMRLNAHLIHGLQPGEQDYCDDDLLQEYRAAQSLGLPVHLREQSAAVPNFTTGTTVIFERQGQFHPLKYMTQLASKLAQRGVRIHCGTHASKVQGGQHSYVKTSDCHTIRAAHIVEATNIPISNKLAIIDKCMPERTYVVALYIPRGVDGECALVYDMAEPYHYVRRCPATDQLDLLIVGGEDHKVGEDVDASSLESRFDRLEQWARRRWPHAMHRAYCWSGQIIEPTDMVAFIGRNDVDHDNVYVVTGDSGNGLTHGVIAGRLLTDLITGSHNEWADLYNPRRMSHSLSTMAKHNMHVGLEYRRWLQGSDVGDIEDLQPCQGAVISCRLPIPSHTAVYKDTQGVLHKMSAVCPHAYGIVHWNPLEHSWDCPAHGSRFTPFGKVVNGPSCSDLKPLPT